MKSIFKKQLFHDKHVYDINHTNDLFFHSVKENVLWHYQHCEEYRQLLTNQNFHPDMLKTYEDLAKLPPIPTLYVKKHSMLSIPAKKIHFKSTTSGTSGKPTEIGFDFRAIFLGFQMVKNLLVHHKMISLRPTNYLILGYQPNKTNKMGAVRTAFAATFLAPALHKEYALVKRTEEYELNIDGVKNALLRYSESKAPVRILGFPSYFYFLLKKLEQEDIALQLPDHSMILLGGGWKQFATQKVKKEELYRLAYERLGIKEECFRDFFGVVEHNVPYFDCKNHHFHVPIYSRILIRDVKTLIPVEYGTPGLLNLLTPLLDSMPLVSIMTDDVAIMHEGKDCGCGNDAPYFEILGRAELEGIVTCSVGAESILGGK